MAETKAKEEGAGLAKYKGSYDACVRDHIKQGKTPPEAAKACASLKAESDTKKETSKKNAETMNGGIRAKLFGSKK